MVDTLHSFGRRLASLRNGKGISQEKLAEMINYSPNHISKLELARTNPSFDLLVKIADALEVNIKELFDFAEEPTSGEMKKQLHKHIDNISDKKLKLLYKICKVISIA